MVTSISLREVFILSLVTLKDMLGDAKEKKYAIGCFNVSNYEMLRAVVEVAEEMRSPVILGLLKPDLLGTGINYLTSLGQTAAKVSTVPICLHLDHSCEIELIKAAVENGFSSVMFDGSQKPFEENVRLTKSVCKYAHKYGITVEGELGHVTDAIAGNSESGVVITEIKNPENYLTDPLEVQRFVDLTGVDALAVAIGTAHGVYLEVPRLDFERLNIIKAISSVPLVLHGGSGVPPSDVIQSINYGICKVNIYSEVLDAYFSTLKTTLNSINNMCTWPVFVYEESVKAMKEVIRQKMILFGSANRA
jgi:ketose-bisphosphate aldolase